MSKPEGVHATIVNGVVTTLGMIFSFMLGANVLVGGSNNSVALQPVSLVGSIAVLMAFGFSRDVSASLILAAGFGIPFAYERASMNELAR